MNIRRSVKFSLPLLLLFFLALSTPFASAHAELVSTNPASGAVLKDLPASVRLEFDEDLLVLNQHNTSVLIVKDRFGTEIEEGDAVVDGRFLTVDLPPTHEFGEFSVTYRVVSDDGHPVQGSYAFEVEVPSGATAQDQPLTSQIHESAPKGATGEGVISPAKEDGGNLLVTSVFAILILAVAALIVFVIKKYSAKRKKASVEKSTL
ncbi:MAG: copper resistance CopC family protein [Actinomycetota bacterium]